MTDLDCKILVWNTHGLSSKHASTMPSALLVAPGHHAPPDS